MQSYSLATLGLLATTLFVAMYVFQGVGDNITRVAIMTNAKPEPATAVASNSRLLSPPPPLQLTEDANPAVVVVRTLPFNDPTPSLLGTDLTLDEARVSEGASLFSPTNRLNEGVPTLPAEYNTYEPVVQVDDETQLGTLAFTTEVNTKLEPVNARRIFSEGRFKMYAAFEYEGMADGMVWSWVWRHEGEVINGGHEMWAYGDNGPGYVYLSPPTGFAPGSYTVDIWVNGELHAQGSFFITSNAAANN